MKDEKLNNQQKNHEFMYFVAYPADKIFMEQMLIEQMNLHKKKSDFYLKQQPRNRRLYF